MDTLTKEKRSEVMSKIKSRGTGPEREMARILRRGRMRYRSQPKLPGSPDFVVEGRLLVFCDGSFWHGRNWPKLKEKLAGGDNPEYWLRHIGGNRRRDRRVNRELREAGYAVIRFWDDDIKKRPERCARLVRAALESAAAPDR